MKRSERRKKIGRYLWWMIIVLCVLILLTALLGLFLQGMQNKNLQKQVHMQNPESDIYTRQVSEEENKMPPAALAWQEQSMFMRTRKPPVELVKPTPAPVKKKEPEKKEEPPPEFAGVLTSIVIHGDTRLAFFRNGAQNLKLYEGDEYQGWLLKKVDNDSVTLENNGLSLHLDLRNYAPSKSQ